MERASKRTRIAHLPYRLGMGSENPRTEFMYRNMSGRPEEYNEKDPEWTRTINKGWKSLILMRDPWSQNRWIDHSEGVWIRCHYFLMSIQWSIYIWPYSVEEEEETRKKKEKKRKEKKKKTRTMESWSCIVFLPISVLMDESLGMRDPNEREALWKRCDVPRSNSSIA